MKGEQETAEKQLNEARQLLFECSAIDNPTQWSTLLDNIVDLVTKLADINNELKRLECKFSPLFIYKYYLNLSIFQMNMLLSVMELCHIEK